MSEGTPFANLLKFWREVSGLSQQDLAFAIDSSPRHISRLENNHVHPSRDMLSKLAAEFDLGDRDYHQLLSAAGYADEVEPPDFDAPELRHFRKSLALLLSAYQGAPAMVFDESARIRMFNRAWLSLFETDVQNERTPTLELYFNALFDLAPNDAQSRNWTDTKCTALMAVKQEGVIRGDESVANMMNRVAIRQCLPEDWQRRAMKFEATASWIVHLNFRGRLLRFMSMSVSVVPGGPSIHHSRPRLVVKSLLPRDPDQFRSIALPPELDHQLLNEHAL